MKRNPSANTSQCKKAIIQYLGISGGFVEYTNILCEVVRKRESHPERALLLGNQALESLVKEGKIEKAWLRTQDTPHTHNGPKRIHYRIKR